MNLQNHSSGPISTWWGVVRIRIMRACPEVLYTLCINHQTTDSLLDLKRHVDDNNYAQIILFKMDLNR